MLSRQHTYKVPFTRSRLLDPLLDLPENVEHLAAFYSLTW
jgi:hypothetical protein